MFCVDQWTCLQPANSLSTYAHLIAWLEIAQQSENDKLYLEETESARMSLLSILWKLRLST